MIDLFGILSSYIEVSDEVRQYLRKPTFDNWQWDDAEMLILLQQMYIDLGFTTKFNIEVSDISWQNMIVWISFTSGLPYRMSIAEMII